MLTHRIWLAASVSIGVHIGLFALLSQAQAMPKVTLPPQAIAISVAMTTAARPTQAVQPPAPQPEPPKPQVKRKPEVVKKPVPAKKAQVKQVKQKQSVRKAPTPAKTVEPTPSTQAAKPVTPAHDTRAPKIGPKPVVAQQEHYPARYRGAQPAPEYPRLARRRGLEGTCIIEVVMNTRGDVIRLALKQSTGHSMLDNAALNAVRNWKFIAPTGISGPSKALVPVRFTLT